MNSWKVILATVVIFGAGVVTGGLLVSHVRPARPELRRNFSDPHREVAAQELPLSRPEMMNKQFIEQLDSALHLAPDQRKAIEKILADGQQRNRDLWKLVAPQMRSVMQDVNQRIRNQLTPEQQKQFEKLMKQLRPQRRTSGTNTPPATLSTTNLPPTAPTNAPPDMSTNAPAM